MAAQNEVLTEIIVKENQLIEQIYESIIIKVLKHLDKFSSTDVIKVIFEISQKKVMPSYFINESRIQQFFQNLNFKEMC